MNKMRSQNVVATGFFALRPNQSVAKLEELTTSSYQDGEVFARLLNVALLGARAIEYDHILLRIADKRVTSTGRNAELILQSFHVLRRELGEKLNWSRFMPRLV